MYLGDFQANDIVDFKFTTVNTSGAPTQLATPFVAVYKDNDAAQTLTGIVVTADFDSITGLNHVRITATGSFYTDGSDYDVVVVTGTVGGTSIVGYTIGHFSITNRPVSLVDDAITAAKIAANAITSSELADGAITAAKFAAGAITATVIATDAIGADEFAQAAADKIWSSSTRTLSAFGFSVTVGTNNDKTGYALSAAGIQAIWDALTSALTTVGSIGKLLVDNVNATISSRSSHAAADVWSVATRLLTAGTNIVLAKGTGVTGFTDLSAADVRTAVGLASANLDTQLAAIAGYIDTEITTVLARIGSFTGSGVNTVLGFFQALMRSDATTPSDLGGTYDDATDSLQAQRDNLGTNGAALTLAKTTNITGFNDLSAAQVNTEADTALSDVGLTTTVTGRIDAAISTRATPVQVNAEVVDALATDTYAQPGQEAPTATTNLANMIRYLYKAFRNKYTQTSTEFKLYADDGTTVDQKSTVSDDGTTFTRGETGTGP